jgi:hypothetical protein
MPQRKRRRVIKDSELDRLTQIIQRIQDFDYKRIDDRNTVGILDDLTNDALNLLFAAHDSSVRVENALDRRRSKTHRHR